MHQVSTRWRTDLTRAAAGKNIVARIQIVGKDTGIAFMLWWKRQLMDGGFGALS